VRRPQSTVGQGFQDIDEATRKHVAMPSKSLDQDRFTHDSTDVASSFTHTAASQVLYAGSNVESKSHENENFHEQTLLSLMKRWYKPI
jgi:ribosomal protein L18E